MHQSVSGKVDEIRALCRGLGVVRLDLFGSAASGEFDEATSDVDVLVEFAGGPDFDSFGAYFSLKEGLEALLGRPVDVVVAAAVQNPYFQAEVARTREPLYAA